MIFIHDYSLDVTGGGDPLTELLDEPVITEYKNERLDLEFTYRADGKHADKIEYFKILSCPCHKSEEELFYIHSIDRSMGGIQVLAKHITYLIDRVPVKGYKGRLTPWNALTTMKKNMVESSPIGFYTTLPADIQEFAVGDNETVHTILHDKFFPTYGGISYRRGKEIGITYERGGTTLYQLAKYKNIQDRSWIGDVDDVVTKVYVRAELDKEWVLPKISGERVAPHFDKYGENGHFSVYVKDKDTGKYIDEVMGFTIYDENGHRIRSAQTGTVEITKKQTENLAKWKEDLAKKRKTLQGHREKKQTEWVREQIAKTEKAIGELEIKIRDFTIGESGKRIFKNARKGKYTLVMTKAPSSYYGNYWTREFTVSDTFSSITFELEKKTKEGATDKLYLYTDRTSPLANKYPVLMVEHYEVHDERIQTQEALNKYAENLFKDDMIDVLFEDFTVEPSDIADDYMLDIGSTLLLYFEAEDVDRRVECVGYTYDPVKERITSYTFGKRRVGIAGVISKAIRKYMGELELRLLERAEGMVAHSQWQTRADIESVNRAIDGVAGDIHLAVNSITADVGTFDQIFANRIETETIVADLGEFKQIVVTDLEAQVARIKFLETNTVRTEELYANYLSAERIRAEFATLEHLESDYAKISTLNAEVAVFQELYAKTAKIVDLQAVRGRIDEIEAKIVTTENLEAINAKILELESSIITADAIESTYATIESLNAEIARVNNLLADKASITDLTAINANIETLLAWDGRIMTLESASADVAELLAGNLTAKNMQAGLIKANSALIEDGAITNAKIDTASVNRIMIDHANIKTTAILDAFIRNLSAEVITTGTLKAGVIGAGTITVDKLESNIGEKLGIVSSEEINIAIQNSIQNTGTENLIKGSEYEHEANEILQYGVGNVFVAGKTYTVSFDLKTSVPQTTLIYSLEGYDIGNHYVESTTEYQRYYFTFDTNTSPNGNNTTFIFNAIPTSGVDIFVRRVQVQEGSIVTGYGKNDSDNKIGGANILDSETATSTVEGTNIGTFTLPKMVEGQEYVFSFDFESSVDGTVLMYSTEGVNVGQWYAQTGNKKRYAFSFKADKDSDSTTLVINAIPIQGATWKLSRPQLQEGTVPTTYQLPLDRFVERDKIISSINLSKEGITISGEKVTINGDTHIENATIKSAHIDDGAITNAHIDNAGIDLAKIEHGELFMMTVENGFISKGTAGELVIDGAQIKEASITSAQIVSLDANLINAGTLSVERLEIRGSEKSIVYEINNITGKTQATNVDTINGEVLTPRTITADRIVANTITSNEIKANSITANEMLTGTITAESGILADLVVTTAKIADLAITTAKIADANITNAKIAKLAVSTANIQDLAVTDAKIANITADKITASWIESGQIKTGSLTTSVISADSWKSLDLSSNTSINLAITDVVETTLPEEVQKQIEANVGEQLPVNIDNLLTEKVDKTGGVYTVFTDDNLHKHLTVGEWYTLSFDLKTQNNGTVLLYSTTGYDIGNHYANVPNTGGRFYIHFQPQAGEGITNLVVNGLSTGGTVDIFGVTLTKGKNMPTTYTDYVRQNKVLASINLSDETVRIQGKRIEITGDTYIQNGVIDNAHISNAGIDFAKIKNVQITSAMISDLTATVTNITTAQIKSATIDWAQIRDVKITNAMIDDGTISTAKIANLEVDIGIIADASIENATIEWAQIRNVRVTNAQIVDLDAGKIKTGILKSKVGGNSINLNTGAFTFTNTTFKGTGTTGSEITIKDGILQTYSDGNYIKIGNGEILIYPTGGEYDSESSTKLNAKSGIITGFTGHYLDFTLPSTNTTGYSRGYVTRADTKGFTSALRFIERKSQVITCVVETVGESGLSPTQNYPGTMWLNLSWLNTEGMVVDMRDIRAIHVQALNEDFVAGYDYSGNNIQGSSHKVDAIKIWYRYVGKLAQDSRKLAFSITLIL